MAEEARLSGRWEPAPLRLGVEELPGAESGTDKEGLLNQESNGPPKPDEAKPVQEVNGDSLEDNTAALQAEPAREETLQPPASDVGMMMTLSQPMEDLSITYPLEFERYWRATQENPLDFTAWTELYPYCYGYWKKYADMERRFDFIKETEEVFQRGLQSIPLSMDLWIHYITFLQSTLDMNQPDSAQKICGTFEAAVAAAGVDFRSDKLWEMYVEWQKDQGDLKAVTSIYDRVLSTPTQLYSHHWEKPYFHVKPLERAQLRNWRDYLDFEMVSGSHERTIVLFERCTFEDYVPGLVMVRLRRVSLERRLGNMDMAEALLMEAIRDNEGMPISSFYSVKLARQVLKVQKNLAKARKILLEALEKDPMEFSADVRQNEGNTMSSFDRALTSGLPLETKIIFSQRRVEFLEDFGSSINSLLMCYEEHQKLLNQQMMRKRLLENGSADETDDKRLRLEDAAMGGGSVAMATTGITPLMATDTSAAGTYNYNTWYQQNYGYQNTWNYNQYYQQT
ncbi:Pre-mRNA-processing factor 39 [Ophiophagus hannah]|uniref:Pre-mRNA-processing factor 39 n=1 Tax=Ophiophagus hannah TaxID=8665 RepID=V8NDK5_OPHHA|nr:Pre-mRNA-processing factor 39 [Ophiophagus hannah]